MATTLYLRTKSLTECAWSPSPHYVRIDGNTATSFTQYDLATSRGSSTYGPVQMSFINGPTNGIEITSTNDPKLWVSPPVSADVTISGSISFALWSWESAMAANAAVNVRIMRADPDTGTLSEVHRTNRTTENPTTAAMQNWSETPTSFTFYKGDRIVMAVFFKDGGGTMASGNSGGVYINGPTANAQGDCNVTFTETITFMSDAAGSTVYLTNSAASIGSTPSLLSDFTGTDESPISEGGNWSKLAGVGYGELRRTSNTVGAVVSATQAGAYWTPASFGPDVQAYITLSTIGQSGIALRVQGAGGNGWDGYLFLVIPSNTCKIVVVTDAAQTDLKANTSVTWSSGDKLGASIDGSTLCLWRYPSGGSAWTLMVAVTDTTYTGSGRVGLFVVNDTPKMDDFYAATGVGYFTSEREAWTSRGGGVQDDVVNTVAGLTSGLILTDTAGGTVVEWYTKPLTAFTLSGKVRVNFRGAESGTLANAQLMAELAVVDGDGSNPVVWAASTGSGTELTASEAAYTWDLAGSDISVTNGQRIRIRVYVDDGHGSGSTGSPMATGYTVTFYYAGTSGGASGDSYLTFSQTLTEYVSGPARVPYRSHMPQLLAH